MGPFCLRVECSGGYGPLSTIVNKCGTLPDLSPDRSDPRVRPIIVRCWDSVVAHIPAYSLRGTSALRVRVRVRARTGQQGGMGRFMT